MKRITEWRPISVRRIGRPRLKWEDNVREDVEKKKQIYRNGVRWLWVEKQGRELLSRPELTENCRAKRRGRINGC